MTPRVVLVEGTSTIHAEWEGAVPALGDEVSIEECGTDGFDRLHRFRVVGHRWRLTRTTRHPSLSCVVVVVREVEP